MTGANARQRAGATGPASTRVEATATCLSWIPPQAVEGMFKLPFGLGVAHYDKPPPDSAPEQGMSNRPRSTGAGRSASGPRSGPASRH